MTRLARRAGRAIQRSHWPAESPQSCNSSQPPVVSSISVIGVLVVVEEFVVKPEQGFALITSDCNS